MTDLADISISDTIILLELLSAAQFARLIVCGLLTSWPAFEEYGKWEISNEHNY